MAKKTALSPQVRVTDRYLLCPAGGFLHDHMGVVISHTVSKGRRQITCACATHAWVSPQIDASVHGYTVDQLMLAGLTDYQRDRKSYTPEDDPSDDRNARYVLCPNGTPPQELQPTEGPPVFGVHHPIALEVEFTAKKGRPTAFCNTCRSRTWLGDRWRPRMGMTLAHVKDGFYGLNG